MSNNWRPFKDNNLDEVEDINVITHYPKEYSDEMVVLVRRIAYLKTKVQKINETQLVVLKDVSTFDNFITNLFLSKNTSISEYFLETDPENPLFFSPSVDNDEEDTYEVVNSTKKKKKK